MSIVSRYRALRIFGLLLANILFVVFVIPYSIHGRRFEADFFGYTYIGYTGSYIDSQVLENGAYEKDILFFMRDYLVSLGSIDKVVLDIGAHTGHHSLFLSKFADTVWSFEPYEKLLVRFREMVSLNKIDNIRIEAIGLGDEEARLPFYEPGFWNIGEGSFLYSGSKESSSGESMRIRPGDAVAHERQIENVRLIKIDIEGYEKFALDGLAETLERDRPLIVMELNTGKDSGIMTEADLRSCFPDSYKFLVFDRPERPGSGSYVLKEFLFARDACIGSNLVAYPEEQQKKIGSLTNLNEQLQ